jgi:hypothetical protein
MIKAKAIMWRDYELFYESVQWFVGVPEQNQEKI